MQRAWGEGEFAGQQKGSVIDGERLEDKAMWGRPGHREEEADSCTGAPSSGIQSPGANGSSPPPAHPEASQGRVQSKAAQGLSEPCSGDSQPRPDFQPLSL